MSGVQVVSRDQEAEARYEAFIEQSGENVEALEAFQRSYRYNLYTRAGVSLLVIVVLMVLTIIQEGGPLIWLGIVLVALVLLVVSMMPAREYRLRLGGLSDRDMKEPSFLAIFAHFDFKFSNKGTFDLKEFAQLGMIPAYDHCLADDSAKGVHRGVEIEIAECHLLEGESTPRTVFRGLAVRCDLGARRRFEGKTLIVAGRQQVSPSLGVHELPMPVKGYENRYRVLSNAEREARRIVTLGTMRSIHHLYKDVIQFERQHEEVDLEALGNAETVTLKGIDGFLSSFAAFLRPYIGVRDVVPAVRDFLFDTASSAISEVRCGFVGDKMLLLIPHPHSLFDPNPLFSAVYSEEDFLLVFSAVENAKAMVDEVLSALGEGAEAAAGENPQSVVL